MQAVLEEQAGLELGVVDTNHILTLLECPVCLDHITPPIKQCIKVFKPPPSPQGCGAGPSWVFWNQSCEFATIPDPAADLA